MRIILVVLMLTLSGSIAQAQGREITVISDLEDAGFWGYVLPRFKLKTRIKVHVVPDQVGDDSGVPVIISDDGVTYSVRPDAPSEDAERFMQWLTSDIGARTMTALGGFSLITAEVEEVVVELEGNTSIGEEVSYRKCGRCHVIGERNKYGGIDSTPSFGALRTLKDWQEKFGVFWTLRPHPSFTQIEGITEPFDPAFPPHIYPIYLTVDEVSDIGAYMQTVTPKDLGPLLEGE